MGSCALAHVEPDTEKPRASKGGLRRQVGHFLSPPSFEKRKWLDIPGLLSFKKISLYTRRPWQGWSLGLQRASTDGPQSTSWTCDLRTSEDQRHRWRAQGDTWRAS